MTTDEFEEMVERAARARLNQRVFWDGMDAMSASIVTSNEEMVTVRDAMRTLNRLVDELSDGRRQKVVLTRHGKMLAVVVSVESFVASSKDQQ